MWLSLWASARYDIRIEGDEFYSLTPRQFDALLQRHRGNKERDTAHTDFLFAQLTSWVANTGFRATDKPTRWQDFSPSEWAKTATSTKADPLIMTPERRTAVADGLRMLFPSSSAGV